jgi:hypothetical protein
VGVVLKFALGPIVGALGMALGLISLAAAKGDVSISGVVLSVVEAYRSIWNALIEKAVAILPFENLTITSRGVNSCSAAFMCLLPFLVTSHRRWVMYILKIVLLILLLYSTYLVFTLDYFIENKTAFGTPVPKWFLKIEEYIIIAGYIFPIAGLSFFDSTSAGVRYLGNVAGAFLIILTLIAGGLGVILS